MNKITEKLIALIDSRWSNVLILIFAGVTSFFVFKGAISKYRGDSYREVFRINELFHEFTSSIQTYSKLIQGSTTPEGILEKLLDNEKIFQVRLIDSLGFEVVKYDKYGFDNKNRINSRPYWGALSALDTDRWHITKAENNIENNPITNEQTITGNTIRVFYRLPHSLITSENQVVHYFGVNLDYHILETKLDSLFPNQDLYLLENGGAHGPLEFIRGLNLIIEIPLNITFDGKRWSILGIRYSYSLLGPLLFLMFFSVVLILIKRGIINWNKSRITEERLNVQSKFVQSWVNMASHHFRHPLANISARLDILKFKDTPPTVEEIEVIQNSFTEFLDVFEYLKKLQVLSDLENRSKEWYSLKKLNELFENRKANSFDIEGIPAEFENFMVWVDPLPFEWALSEIVDNAIAHSNGNKVVTSINHTDNYVALRIEDNGMGIPQNIIELLNSDLNKSSDKGFESGSFGLGLLQFSKIIHLHGFEIKAKNLPIGGSRIEIRIAHNRILRK